MEGVRTTIVLYESQPDMAASSRAFDNEAARQPCGCSSSCGRLSPAGMRDGRRHAWNRACSFKPPRQTLISAASFNAAHGEVEMK
jgi:hypothetical protein